MTHLHAHLHASTAHQAVLQAERELLETHRELVDDPRNSVEGLDRAACPAHISDLARLATGAAAGHVGADQWRSWIVDSLGPHAGNVLDTAETCMRTNGLWPWRD